MKDSEKHPWGAFLIARRNAILWMQDKMEYDDVQIARTLSMDPMQVFLIKNSKCPITGYDVDSKDLPKD